MDVESLRVQIFKKQKSGMLETLFSLNPKLNEVNVTIVQEINEQNSMIVPYRNTKCKQLQCLYDEDELIQLYIKNNKKMSFTIPCKVCKTKINFQDFFLDEDLYENVNRNFSCYNKSEIVVREVVMMRGGECKPLFLKRPGSTIVRDTEIPSMRNYSDDEYFSMKQCFEQKGKNAFVSQDTIITRMGLMLEYDALEELQEEQITSFPLMAFLLNYAFNHQENIYQQKGQLNLKKNVCIIAMLVHGLTPEKQLDAEYLPNFENYYSTEELANNYEDVAVVIYYEKTWSLLLGDLAEQQCHFYIFKDHMKNEYASILSSVIAEQFDLKNSVINYVENFSFHSPTEAKYSGTIIFRLLMWLIDPPGNPQPFSELSSQQLDIIRKQTSLIEWLLYQMMKQDKKTGYIFEGMEVQKAKSNDGSMPSIVSLQGITSPGSSQQINDSYQQKDPKKEGKSKKKKKSKKKSVEKPIEEVDSEQEEYSDRELQHFNQDLVEEENSEEEDDFNFQQEFEEIKRKYGKKKNVNIPKDELDRLVEKLQYDVSKEIQKKRQQEEIEKETMADYYINKKLQEFDIKVKMQKTKKKKKRRKGQEDDDDENDDGGEEEEDIVQMYEKGELTKEDLLEKQQVQLSLGQLKDIFSQFEGDMHKRINFKNKHNVQDAVDKQREADEYMEWYSYLFTLYFNSFLI